MKKLFFTLCCFAFSTVTFAATSALQDLDKLLSSWKTLSANFTQQIFDVTGEGQEVYTGHIYLHKPNRLRWVITDPEPQLIVADGKNLWIFDEELEQVTVQPLTNQLSETPALFLSGEFTSVAQAFTVQSLEDSKEGQRFLVKPKQEDSLLANMVLTFDKENRLTRMQINDVFEQTTEIKFTSIQVNPKLDDKLFTFVPPKNVDVVGESQ